MHANKQLRVTVGPISCSGCDKSINNQYLCEIFIHRHQFAVYLSIYQSQYVNYTHKLHKT